MRRSANDLHPPIARPRVRSPLREAADTLWAVAQTALLLVIFTALVGRYEIRQTSMEPSFHEGQRVMVSQVGSVLPPWVVERAHAAGGAGTRFDLRRGQVVVFHEDAARTGDALIKRLVGLPGDTIAIRGGAVFVNGRQLDESYIAGALTDCQMYCELTLGPDEYFFMGDNRAVSRDSRSFGPIDGEQIVGRVIARFWPLDRLALFL
jgi:signal peptidase I